MSRIALKQKAIVFCKTCKPCLKRATANLRRLHNSESVNFLLDILV